MGLVGINGNLMLPGSQEKLCGREALCTGEPAGAGASALTLPFMRMWTQAVGYSWSNWGGLDERVPKHFANCKALNGNKWWNGCDAPSTQDPWGGSSCSLAQ